VKKNSNPARKYEFDGNQLEVTQDWEEPFGFLILDTGTLSLEMKTFHPSACTIEIEYDISGKEMVAIKEDWRTILSAIAIDAVNSGKYSTVLVMPIISGTMERLTKVTLEADLKAVGEDFSGIYIVEPRFGKINPISYSIEEDERLPELSKDAVVRRTLQQVEEIRDRLAEKDILVDKAGISKVIQVMTSGDDKFFQDKGNHKDITFKMVNLLLDFLKDQFGIEINEIELNKVITNAFGKKEA